MSRLIVVSNRVPSPDDEAEADPLAIALKARLRKQNGVWIGCSNRVADKPDSAPARVRQDGIKLATIDLSRREFVGYDERHANRSLWPLLHGRLDLARFDRESHAQYRRVNRRLADAAYALRGADDVLWVHDYHLVPLGSELRRRTIIAPIGFFLHTPFPPAGILAALPWHRELLSDLSAYDLVGFQTENCVRNFTDSVNQLLPQSRHALAAQSFPMGIDTNAFSALAASSKAQRWSDWFKRCMERQAWAVNADRLDHTAGLVERFKALEVLFERSPELRGRFSLMQVAAPSKRAEPDFSSLQGSVDAAAGRVNGRHARFDWTPIHYINRALDRAQLAAFYRAARVGVMTPLRDGMSTAAKEYLAAQNPDDPGVLVLSRFSGAAHELTDALLVNPYEPSAVANAIRMATCMPLAERRARWTRMMRHLRRHEIGHWCGSFLDALASKQRSTRLKVTSPTPTTAPVSGPRTAMRKTGRPVLDLPAAAD